MENIIYYKNQHFSINNLYQLSNDFCLYFYWCRGGFSEMLAVLKCRLFLYKIFEKLWKLIKPKTRKL
jgi:hypothetical protein